MNNIKNICVFCSSSNFLNEKYYQDAKELGKLIGQNGYNIVYGGSTLGMMWECASEVKNNGGKIYGVMPKKLADLGCRTDNCDEFFLSDGMRDRKAKMDELSDAVIVLAGGFGSAISEFICDNNCQASLLRLGIGDTFVEHAKQAQLHEELGLEPKQIAAAISKFLNKRRK